MSETATAATPEENLEASKSHALQAAEELREAASQKAAEIKDAARERAGNLRELASDKASEARAYAEDRYEEMRSVADEYRIEGERYVRENPAKSVLIALGIGFVIGRILR